MSSVVIFKRIAAMGAEFEALLAEAVDGSAAERAAAAHAWETFERRLPAMRDRLVAGLAQVPTDQLGEPSLAAALSTLLRISKAQASRRIGEAQELGPRAAMTGQALEPMLANTAAAQQRGQINAEQVRIIRRFFDRLPGFVDHATANPPKRNWPSWPAGCGPRSCGSALTGWPICSIKTANCPTRTAPGAGI